MKTALSFTVVALLAGLLAPSALAAPATADALAVTAFQGDWNSPDLIDQNAAAITTVGVDGVTLTASGTSVSDPVSDDTRQLSRSHDNDLRAELLVSNFSEASGDFSEPLAYQMLSSPANRQNVVDSLTSDVVDGGWDGISVDLESLLVRDRAGLTAFVTALNAALPAGASLSINVQPHDRVAGYAPNGFDLTALAAQVDRLILMAYDQHGPWENQPGPVGALPWATTCLTAMLKKVPAAQIDLGIAGYGYAWRPHSNDTLSDAQARALAGSKAKWNQRNGEWTATLADGSTLWWSDHRSYLARTALAQQYNLHGIALWNLGLSDPLV